MRRLLHPRGNIIARGSHDGFRWFPVNCADTLSYLIVFSVDSQLLCHAQHVVVRDHVSTEINHTWMWKKHNREDDLSQHVGTAIDW